MTTRKLIIFGAGNGISSVINMAHATGYDIAALIAPDSDFTSKYDIPVQADLGDLKAEDHDFCLGVGSNFLREKIYHDIIQSYPKANFPNLIHPTAYLAEGTKLGQGNILFPGTMVGAYCTIGDFCWLNTKSSLDHDGVMEDYSSLAPAVTTGGQVQIGKRTTLGISSVVKHGITIGTDTVIGANSYVHHDIGNNLIAYGSPAKARRPRQEDDPYL